MGFLPPKRPSKTPPIRDRHYSTVLDGLSGPPDAVKAAINPPNEYAQAPPSDPGQPIQFDFPAGQPIEGGGSGQAPDPPHANPPIQPGPQPPANPPAAAGTSSSGVVGGIAAVVVLVVVGIVVAVVVAPGLSHPASGAFDGSYTLTISSPTQCNAPNPGGQPDVLGGIVVSGDTFAGFGGQQVAIDSGGRATTSYSFSGATGKINYSFTKDANGAKHVSGTLVSDIGAGGLKCTTKFTGTGS